MTETTVNAPLLRKVLEHITEHPEEHDQDTWGVQTPCGTKHCLAGHVVAMTGHRLIWSASTDAERRTSGATRSVDRVDGFRSVESVAQVELGLSDQQAGRLFWDATTITELWDIAQDITDGEIRPPADPDGEAAGRQAPVRGPERHGEPSEPLGPSPSNHHRAVEALRASQRGAA